MIVSVDIPFVLASLTDQLLGLDRVSWSDQQAVLSWQPGLPLWAWVLIVVGSSVVAGWSYRRLLGPRAGRTGLAVIRSGLLIFLACLLAGPVLVLRQEKIEPDWLLMLVDRSASMQIKDTDVPGVPGVPGTDQATHQLISRDQAFHQAVVQHAQVLQSDELHRDRRVVWLGFDSDTFEIDPPHLAANPLDQPDGQTTAIRTAIEQALARATGQPVSGVVLFTDGRSSQSTGADLVKLLRQQAVSVFPVPLGTATSALDLAVTRVDAPDRAFINDQVPVTVWLDRYPHDAPVDPQRVSVKLVDTQTGQLLDEQSLSDQGINQPVRLSGESTIVGPARWNVQLVYDPPPDQQELIVENNTQTIDMELIDRPIRVLYVEGYPRWEYRYLKSVLVREQSIRSSIVMIGADRGFAQEGDEPIIRLPRDAQEMQPYDVIIIGDVPSGYFSPDQLTMLKDHVSARGAGLLWIGGQYFTPRSYEATPLTDLLPMRHPAQTQRLNPRDGPVVVTPTPLAQWLSVLRFHEPSTPPDVKPTWPPNLPPLIWAQDIGPLKPSVEVLAQAQSESGSPIPLVLRMRYGAGQSLYVATDETWRWRYGLGSVYFEQFWVQLVRMLGRNRVGEETQDIHLSASHRRVELGQPIVVQLRVADAILLKRQLPKIAVDISIAGDKPASGTQRIVLVPQTPPKDELGRVNETISDRSTSNARVYQTIWQPASPGRLLLRVVEPGLDDLDMTLPIEVIRPDDELKHPLPDHDRLVALAKQTGGQVIALDELDQLANVVPNRSRRMPNDISEPLWDSPLSLIVIVTLLTVEWVGRKVIRLI